MKKYWLLLLLPLFLFACEKEENEDIYLNLLSNDNIEMYVGDEVKISFETNCNDVKIIIENEEIASVENNIIKGLGVGFTPITIKAKDKEVTIFVQVNKKKTEIEYVTINIEGDPYQVRKGSNLEINIKEYFGGYTHPYYDDKTFIDWYLDSEFKNKCDMNMNVTENISLYGKYETIEVTSEVRIEVDNIIGFNGEFKQDAKVQTYSPAYGTFVSDIDYNNYTFVIVEYNVSELDYFITSFIEDGDKKETIIPVNGFIVVLNKNANNYLNIFNNIEVGDKITLSKYSVNTAKIIYVNETRNETVEHINPTGITCTYYSVYDVRNKESLYNHNGDSKAYPASVTKVITAIAALSNAKLEDKITIGDELDITYEGSSPSTAGLKKGQIWTLRQLLYAMILPSGNDAAYGVAACTIDSKYPNNTYTAKEKIALFSDLMNEVCVKCGATNSHFLTPDGNSYYTKDGQWDERITNHYTTANDMVKIANYGFQFGALAEVVSTQTINFRLESKDYINVGTTNSMLKTNNSYYYDGIVGMKTGTTTPAGYCLVSGVERNRRFIIIATLNNQTSPGRYDNSIKLYNMIFK